VGFVTPEGFGRTKKPYGWKTFDGVLTADRRCSTSKRPKHTCQMKDPGMAAAATNLGIAI
jgi:hypothetical protein